MIQPVHISNHLYTFILQLKNQNRKEKDTVQLNAKILNLIISNLKITVPVQNKYILVRLESKQIPPCNSSLPHMKLHMCTQQ